jgi:CHAT domain-containing protein/tetratricopeptide (TPR) repeat protein
MRLRLAIAVLPALLLSGCNRKDRPGRARAVVTERSAVSPAPATSPGVRSAPAPAGSVALARAESLYFRGQYDSARVAWRSLLHVDPIEHDSATQAHIMMWLGLAAWRRGEYKESRTLGEGALALKQRLGRKRELSRSYNALGLLARDEGRLTDAAMLFRNAMESARATNDTPGINRAAANLGLVYLDVGDFVQARRGLEAARAAGHALGDARLEGNALNNLGMLTIKLGDPAGAVPMLQDAGRLYASIDYGTGQQNMLGQLATAYDLLGDPQRAFAVLDSAMRLAHAQGLRQEEANNLRLLAEFYQGAGDHQRALDFFSRAYKASAALDLKQETGIILRGEALSESALGRHDLAQSKAADALHIHREQRAAFEELTDLLLLAELAQMAGEKAPANAYTRDARSLARHLDVPSARADVALTEARLADRDGDSHRTLRALDAARDDIGLSRSGIDWEAYALRARALAREGKLDSAATAGRLAMTSAERVRRRIGSGELRTSFTTERASIYADLTIVLLRLGRTDEAFQVADAARGRALLEHLSEARRELRTGSGTAGRLAESEALLRQIDELMSLLNEAERVPKRERGSADDERTGELAARLEKMESEYDALLTRTLRDGWQQAALLGARRTRVAEVQQALLPNEALLEYFLTPNKLIVFVVRPASVKYIAAHLPEADLISRIRVARGLLTRRNPESNGTQTVLKRLHETVITPIQNGGMLRGVQRMIVVPHGALTYLPFSALQNPITGRFVSDDYSILHLPSAGALLALRKHWGGQPMPPRSAHGAVVLAPFPEALPATRNEARSIRMVVGGTTALLGPEASESAFRNAIASDAIVHVATHAVLNVENPLFSRIDLAPPTTRGGSGTAEDGRLDLHELLSLSIRSPLVFLSGCETGLGAAWATDFARGEDYATLGQAFLSAGARDVVATLWRIDDEGAAAFAERFYERLRELPPPEALASAQRDMRRDPRFREAYYWAAYEVTGSGDQVGVKKSSWNPLKYL